MFWHSIYKKCVALVGCLHCKVYYNRNSTVKLLYAHFRNSSFREHIGATIYHTLLGCDEGLSVMLHVLSHNGRIVA